VRELVGVRWASLVNSSRVLPVLVVYHFATMPSMPRSL
jgi:hypothetical protein